MYTEHESTVDQTVRRVEQQQCRQNRGPGPCTRVQEHSGEHRCIRERGTISNVNDGEKELVISAEPMASDAPSEEGAVVRKVGDAALT